MSTYVSLAQDFPSGATSHLPNERLAEGEMGWSPFSTALDRLTRSDMISLVEAGVLPVTLQWKKNDIP